MPVNRDYYWNDEIAKNLSDKYFAWSIKKNNSLFIQEPATPPTPNPILPPVKMITLAESDKRVKVAYKVAFQTAIDHLLLEVETYKKEASAVNIFDTLRLVKIGQKKALQKAADHLYMLLHGHYPID